MKFLYEQIIIKSNLLFCYFVRFTCLGLPHTFNIFLILPVRRRIRPHEWNNDRMSLTNWSLQDRIKATMDRIATKTPVLSTDVNSRMTNSQRFDSSLPTWMRGEHAQMYLCDILDGSRTPTPEVERPVFRP